MKKKFGDYLRELRIEKGMSQQELADLLGTTKQVISKYETNQRTPKITVANEYAQKLIIPLNYLLGVKESTDSASGAPEVDELKNGFLKIQNGIATEYDKLSDENKRIIDRQIKFLLYEQSQEGGE